MKVNIDLNIHQSETVRILELKTKVKKDKRKSTQMEDQDTKGKENDRV